ncbi:hypothetical protein EVAR_71021_1 [Eumeta japonica]|uniref:Uncharacterized protein n=1 Tax=Eumeta variegata TaxID=151549 RepID=A0A4C2AAB3_EUMVA|nr:hypothetical protein EVAR_71021_1 [Eumeta japonica]
MRNVREICHGTYVLVRRRSCGRAHGKAKHATYLRGRTVECLEPLILLIGQIYSLVAYARADIGWIPPSCVSTFTFSTTIAIAMSMLFSVLICPTVDFNYGPAFDSQPGPHLSRFRFWPALDTGPAVKSDFVTASHSGSSHVVDFNFNLTLDLDLGLVLGFKSLFCSPSRLRFRFLYQSRFRFERNKPAGIDEQQTRVDCEKSKSRPTRAARLGRAGRTATF